MHEAVHAYSDILGRPLSVETDEGCAYLASALYLMSVNGANAVAAEPLRNMALSVKGQSGLGSPKAIKAAYVEWLKTCAHAKAGNTGDYAYDGMEKKSKKPK